MKPAAGMRMSLRFFWYMSPETVQIWVVNEAGGRDAHESEVLLVHEPRDRADMGRE